MPVPPSLSDYLRTYTTELGERILASYPPLHSVDDAPSPVTGKLLRKLYPAQTAAILGLLQRCKQARPAAVIAESGTGKTLISMAAIHCHKVIWPLVTKSPRRAGLRSGGPYAHAAFTEPEAPGRASADELLR